MKKCICYKMPSWTAKNGKILHLQRKKLWWDRLLVDCFKDKIAWAQTLKQGNCLQYSQIIKITGYVPCKNTANWTYSILIPSIMCDNKKTSGLVELVPSPPNTFCRVESCFPFPSTVSPFQTVKSLIGKQSPSGIECARCDVIKLPPPDRGAKPTNPSFLVLSK